MTEEQKQSLIEYCARVLSGSNNNSPMEQVYRIALAALTAQPVAWHVYQWRDSPKGWNWYLTRAFASKPNNSDGWRSVELFTRPAPAADRVPEGWKLVPVEITQEMVDANFEGVCIGGIQAGYRAMLAAAPEVE